MQPGVKHYNVEANRAPSFLLKRDPLLLLRAVCRAWERAEPLRTRRIIELSTPQLYLLTMVAIALSVIL